VTAPGCGLFYDVRRQDLVRMLRLRLLGRSAKPGSAKLRSAHGANALETAYFRAAESAA
jgi:hypothetical protein